jgi:hypothetical protein
MWGLISLTPVHWNDRPARSTPRWEFWTRARLRAATLYVLAGLIFAIWLITRPLAALPCGSFADVMNGALLAGFRWVAASLAVGLPLAHIGKLRARVSWWLASGAILFVGLITGWVVFRDWTCGI